MLKLKNKKYWFTLAETVILCSLFSFFIMWVIAAINKSFTFVNNTRLAVRAANFAREWMEMMYNIRDTNRRKNAWQRDANWLNLGINSTDHFKKWFYKIEQDEDGSINAVEFTNPRCSYAEQNNAYGSETEFFDDPCGFVDFSKMGDSDVMTGALTEGVDFYRIVHVLGVYKKDTNNTNEEVSGTALTNWTPAEMRFCVKVFYKDGNWKHATELCGLMTNFTE